MFRRKRHLCPCCGYLTLEDTSPGSHLICPICFWEDDPLQFEEPDLEDGANVVSLRQAQRNFGKFGCSEERFREHVRSPTKRDRRGVQWRPLE